MATGGCATLNETQLRDALTRFLPAGASRFRSFTVCDAQGRMRMGTRCTDAGWYAEMSNFLVDYRALGQGARADYCAPWEGVAGV